AAGVYSFDLASHGYSTLVTVVKQAGATDPIRPALIHPDVTDDSKWNGGFEAGFIDHNPETAYSFSWERLIQLWINTDQVKDGELNSARDLVNPKWKGRIAFFDPRTGGQTYIPATSIRLING